MPDPNVVLRRAFFFGLEEPLVSSLSQALKGCACATAASRPAKPDIVFCSNASGVLRDALAAFPGIPVVVVSRLPEVDGWLDALEAGAADYCAPPFEIAQIRWLLETHARPRRAFAAA